MFFFQSGEEGGAVSIRRRGRGNFNQEEREGKFEMGGQGFFEGEGD